MRAAGVAGTVVSAGMEAWVCGELDCVALRKRRVFACSIAYVRGSGNWNVNVLPRVELPD